MFVASLLSLCVLVQRTYFCGVILRSQGVASHTPPKASIFRSSKNGLGGGRSPVTRRIGERGSSWSGRVRAQSAQRASDPSGRRRLALVRLACPPSLPPRPLESMDAEHQRGSHWLPRRRLHQNRPRQTAEIQEQEYHITTSFQLVQHGTLSKQA